jgi:hypothetical protein
MSALLSGTATVTTPGPRAPALAALADVRAGDGWLAETLSAAARTDTQPGADQPRAQNAGAALGGVNEALYGRLLIEPTTIRVGNLVSDTVRAVNLWNGFSAPATLSDVQQVDTDGMALGQPVALPYEFAPLESLTYTLTITTDGPPAIDASVTWTVDGVPYTVVVVGSRIVLFPTPPNWASPVAETLSWKTDVLRAYDGSEQRIEVRSRPRREFAYDFMATGQDAARTLTALQGWQNRLYALPVWTDTARLELPVLAGDQALVLDADTRSFQPGASLVIYQDARRFELAEIDTVGDTIQLASGVSRPWPVGTRVYPAVVARAPSAMPMQRHTGSVLTGRATFLCSAQDTWPYLPAAPAPDVYNGHEIITRQPNWIRPIEFDSQYAYELVDNDTGVWETTPTEAFSRLQHRYAWLLKDRTEIQRFREFLGRRRGRAKPVYVPTYTEDFRLLETVAGTATRLLVEDNGFATLLGASATHQHLVVRTRAGGFYPRRIVDAVAGLDDTASLYVDTALGFDLAPADVAGIHLLLLCRLAGDQVLMQWRTNGVVTVETPFVSVAA